MTTTVRDILELFANLKALNGQEAVVKIEGQKDRTIVTPFQFDAKTCWNLAKNLNLLKKHIEVFEEARAKLAESIGGPNGVDANDKAKMDEFLKGVDELLDEEVLLEGLLKLKLSGLNLDKNAIQPGILANLSELIEE